MTQNKRTFFSLQGKRFRVHETRKGVLKMADSVQGGPASPQRPNANEEYKHEYNESVKIFSESLQEYHGTTEFQKKAMLKDAMSKSLQAMGDSAAGMLNQELQAQKEKLQSDYESYTAHESEKGYETLQDDLKSMEK